MIATKEIDEYQDIIDSRDIIARLDYLEGSHETESRQTHKGDCGLDEGEHEELVKLAALAKEGEDYAPDWKDGEALIRDSHFKEYAQELAEDIGAINANATWPNDCIDWDRAARELQMDYSAIEFGDVTYWVRS